MVAKLITENDVSDGSIVNMSSIVGRIGNIGQCNYAASKAAVMGFTKTAAKELSKFGIRVNAVLPGFIQTPMTEKVPEKVIEMMKSMMPLSRMGKPEEVAEVCLFLSSPRHSYDAFHTGPATTGVKGIIGMHRRFRHVEAQCQIPTHFAYTPNNGYYQGYRTHNMGGYAFGPF